MKHNKFIECHLEDNRPVWINKLNVDYIHEDNTKKNTRSFVYFNGKTQPLAVKEHSAGLRDEFEKC